MDLLFHSHHASLDLEKDSFIPPEATDFMEQKEMLESIQKTNPSGQLEIDLTTNQGFLVGYDL